MCFGVDLRMVECVFINVMYSALGVYFVLCFSVVIGCANTDLVAVCWHCLCTCLLNMVCLFMWGIHTNIDHSLLHLFDKMYGVKSVQLAHNKLSSIIHRNC